MEGCCKSPVLECLGGGVRLSPAACELGVVVQKSVYQQSVKALDALPEAGSRMPQPDDPYGFTEWCNFSR